MKYFLFLATIFIIKTQISWAKEDQLHGFTINNELINPVCIHKIFPALSESNFIIKSIILEECQKSNFAFHDGNIKISDNKVYVEGKDEQVQYQVIGKTSDGIFIIFFNGNIGAYEIKEEFIKIDLLEHQKEKQHILSVVGYSFVPCFRKGIIENDTLIIQKNVYNPDAPRSDQCTNILENVKYIITK